jgi:hypothetical protein
LHHLVFIPLFFISPPSSSSFCSLLSSFSHKTPL